MNENSIKILKANMRYLGNTFFAFGVVCLVLAVVVEVISYATKSANPVLSSAFTGLIVLTPLGMGMWLGVSIIGRRIRLLEKIEATKKEAELKQLK
jgi:hypothetical protein